MDEAGRLGELQARLREQGVAASVLLAPYESSSFGEPEAEETLEFVERYVDADDPDANYPVLTTNEDELSALMPWEGDRPKRCILSPEREIAWCGHGHGNEAAFEQAALDLWSTSR